MQQQTQWLCPVCGWKSKQPATVADVWCAAKGHRTAKCKKVREPQGGEAVSRSLNVAVSRSLNAAMPVAS